MLQKIKCKHNLKNVFDYLTYDISLKIAYGNKMILDNLELNSKKYKKFYEIKNILKPSIEIDKYYKRFDIKHDEKGGAEIEELLYGCFNMVPFNTDLFLYKENWKYIIKNIHKCNLKIDEKLIKYIDNLDKENKPKILNLLNLYKINIVELDVDEFENFDANKILFFVQNIFQNNFGKYNLKKLSINISKHKHQKYYVNYFLNKSDGKNDCNLIKFLDQIDSIIDLASLKEIEIKSKYLHKFNKLEISDINEIIKIIPKKFISLNKLKIDGFLINSKNNTFEELFKNQNLQIEYLDLSNSIIPISVLKTLYLNKYPLKEIKLNLDIEYNTHIDLSFLSFNENTLEVFEIYNNNNINQNIINIFPFLNKIKNLKKLVIKGVITISQLIELKNIQNIEYFDVKIINSKEDKNSIEHIDNFFKDFKNLKTLILNSQDEIYENSSQLSLKLPYMNLPNNLKIIEFHNINGKNIKSVIERNIKDLLNIEEIKIDNSDFKIEELKSLFDSFRLFKNLLKLSLNNIKINELIYDRKKKRNKNKNVFLQYLPDIFRKIETIPTLIGLDINNNIPKNQENYFISKKFKEIINILPKQLLNLEIFKDVVISNIGNYNNLVKNYQTLINLGSYEPHNTYFRDDNDYSNDHNDYNDYRDYDDYSNDYNDERDYYDVDDYTGAVMGLWDWNND